MMKLPQEIIAGLYIAKIVRVAKPTLLYWLVVSRLYIAKIVRVAKQTSYFWLLISCLYIAKIVRVAKPQINYSTFLNFSLLFHLLYY